MASKGEARWLLVESDHKEEAYKFVIAVSLGAAGLGVLLSCLAIPAFVSYTSHMKAYSQVDLDYCRSANIDLAANFASAKASWVNSTSGGRHKRYEPTNQLPAGAFQGGGQILLATGLGFQECPACCVPGVRGPSGDPGLPGMHGAPGPDGSAGRPGITPNASCIPERVFEPPPCLPCPQGTRGQPGHPGFPGEAGLPGPNGNPGNPGYGGPPGGLGVQGPPGPRGPTGATGDAGATPEANVISGPPGDPGDPGPWGLPGHAGLLGNSGFPGTPGERGWPGPPGDPGLVGPRGPDGPTGETGPPGTPGTCVCQETEVVVADAAQNAYDYNKRPQAAPPASAPLPPIIPDYPDRLERGPLRPQDTFLPVLDEDDLEYYDDDQLPEGLGGEQPLGPFSPGAQNIAQAQISQNQQAFEPQPPSGAGSDPSDFFKWNQAPDGQQQEGSPPSPPRPAQTWGRGQ